jgi:glycosyltransferase involved in cell wall biosynthesis
VKPLVSIIIPCKNEGENIKCTIDSILSTQAGVEYEIIVVDDASTDGCTDRIKHMPEYEIVKFAQSSDLGAAKARNLGIKYAEGQFYIFCDSHIFVEEDWLRKLADTFTDEGIGAVCPGIASTIDQEIVGYGETINGKLDTKWYIRKPPEPTEVPVAPGGCVMFPKKIFAEVGGFCEAFKRWGYEDLEISMRAQLLGYKLLVNPEVKILHLFRDKHPYKVKWEEVDYNLVYLSVLHFSKERCLRLLSSIREKPHFAKVLKEVIDSDVWEQRNLLLAKRVYDDDFYIKKFNLPL